eukprot:1355962-Pyramimonas_sp.AAC.1
MSAARAAASAAIAAASAPAASSRPLGNPGVRLGNPGVRLGNPGAARSATPPARRTESIESSPWAVGLDNKSTVKYICRRNIDR